ncbi:MAG: hypothetical protein PHC66_01460 [Candidatus Nanoarchaeia archaeon]|nr:hypothetical protein [Candidatus Nanoarchaeia archaeon]MDD5239174.1 hypothetical protein [Candidatus Nanoarchaeia archaeon]
MNKKAIELPMATIVTIVIVLFVLVGVGIMFFQQFGASKTQGFDQGQCVSLCQTAKAVHAANLPLGLCKSNQAAKNYCSSCTGSCLLSENGPTLTCGPLLDNEGIKVRNGLTCLT